MTPLMLQYTLGHDFMPPSIHAGGLRYHGASALVSQLYHEKLIEAVAVPQVARAGVTFARAEGIIPAPESCHARSARCWTKRCVARPVASRKPTVQPVRPRSFRYGGLRQYFCRQAGRLRVSADAIEAALERLPKVK